MYKIYFGIYVVATIVLAAFLVCLWCVLRKQRPKKGSSLRSSVNEVYLSEEDSEDFDVISVLPEERYGLGSCCGDGGMKKDSNYFLQILVLILLCLASRAVYLAVVFI